MKLPRVYQLSDRYFSMEVQGGALISVKPGPGLSGEPETQFVLPGHSFGELRLAWRQGENEREFCFGKSAPWETEPPARTLRETTLSASCAPEGVPLSLRVSYRLAERSVRQEFRLRNTSDGVVELLDVGFPFPCNTDFQWGGTASDKVIGHNFIGGHGSHLLFVRCDGAGPYLLAFPEDGTSLEYFDQAVFEGESPVFTAYALSARAVRPAREAQTRMPAPGTSRELRPGEEAAFIFRYVWAADYGEARRGLVEYGLVDVEAVPGLTVPAGAAVSLALSSSWEDLKPVLPFPEQTRLEGVERRENRRIFRLRFYHPGENVLRVEYAGGRWTTVTFFVTQAVPTLIEKRGAFIAAHQLRDPEQWYCGLLAEWNNETGALLGPDNYDAIGGWRIYEVSCDDPGLSKPAFLSGKLAEYPVREQVAALDLYVERFVWGGLQCTEEEPYPYALYGIPDWKQNRDSLDEGLRGKLHIWRIYDYPHIALMYYNLYRIARDYPGMPLSQTRQTYLKRAYGTAAAMFTIPMELDRWDACKTGLYNELCIEDILCALRREGMEREAERLERHWDRKMKYFVTECTDIFGSEYPFDTTGFESTHALARRALSRAEDAVREDRFDPPMLREQAVRFLEKQMACNIACRGVLEPAYYWYGSDYRSNNSTYTLSYMSQMGGWAILDYALYLAEDPYPLLRLGYGSLLSSWALLNAGEAGDGYWFPGAQNDGAASGGFEPLACGKTWLDQPHRGGPWYYSCEIDLGFCGALRGAATILAEDPDFGWVCYGGEYRREKDGLEVDSADGVSRRFHLVSSSGRLHFCIDKGHFQPKGSVSIRGEVLEAAIDPCGAEGPLHLSVQAEGFGPFRACANGVLLGEDTALEVELPLDSVRFPIRLEFSKPLPGER